jgi:hypothetical protein
MLVVGFFIAICVAAVFILLRFLVAIESDIRSNRNSPSYRLDRLPADRGWSSAGAFESFAKLVLVHSSQPRQAIAARRANVSGISRNEENSRLNEA